MKMGMGNLAGRRNSIEKRNNKTEQEQDVVDTGKAG